jgi:hypothetical protein
MLDIIGGAYSVRSLANQLYRDVRFVRTDRREFGLAVWGLEEYSGIAQEIVERIERAGGAVGVEDLVVDLTSNFAVKENSVRLFVQTPRFVVEGGRVRLRGIDEQPVVRARVSSVKGAYACDEGIIWHWAVDSDALRGSGRSFPNDLAGYMQICPGQVRRFEGPEGPLTVTWRDASVTGASISSVRGLLPRGRAVESDDAMLGRVLRIGFALVDNTYSHELLPIDCVGSDSLELLRTLTGLPIPRGLKGEDLRDFVSRTLEVSASDVMRTLRNRDDQAVAQALAQAMLSVDDISEVDEEAKLLAELLIALD